MKPVLTSFWIKKFLFPILSVIAQRPAPRPSPSDEKLDFDDDTLKGKKITLSALLILHLIVFYTLCMYGRFWCHFKPWLTIPAPRSAVGLPGESLEPAMLPKPKPTRTNNNKNKINCSFIWPKADRIRSVSDLTSCFSLWKKTRSFKTTWLNGMHSFSELWAVVCFRHFCFQYSIAWQGLGSLKSLSFRMILS